MIVDLAVYSDGRRVARPAEIAGMAQARPADDGVAWVALYRPSKSEFSAVAKEFDLHAQSVEDAVRVHQRAKLARYGETLFCALRAARYLDDREAVEFSELHAFAAPGVVVTVRHGDAPDLPALRRCLEARPELLRRGPVGILNAIVERVVVDYVPVLAGVANDIDEIEDEVFGGAPDVSRRVYELSREVIAFQRATKPLASILEQLTHERDGGNAEEMHLREVRDQALRVVDQADGMRQLLQNILNVNLTLETKAQNEEVKMISAWAAILFAPTLVGTAYGMNFESMPGTDLRFGFLYALLLMAGTSVALYLVFKHRNWI